MGKKDKNVWTSKVGRDCVSLDTSLCRWLGKRLSHLATHSTGVPVDYIDMFKNSGADNSPVLSDGQDAMRWVAKWLPNLWD
jgi:CubicO group peptidase (beta-lactamase class C family)